MNRWMVSGILAIFLVACGQQKPVAQSPKRTEVEQSQQEQTTERTETQETVTETETALSYNGSYYAVQGKYAEIVIVNKRHPLAANYAPGENSEAKQAFLDLLAAMRQAGFAVSDSYSGYRSYDTQASLYQDYLARDGQAQADRYSARPGYSEHQTGLAFDILDTSGQLLTEEAAATWLREHAADYGFIVRYLEGKEEETGYMPESWHLRYVGQEATEIAQSGKSLEAYFSIEGGNYPD